MNKENSCLEECISEMITASEKKHFMDMSEIYAEIQRLVGKTPNKPNVFFSELGNDHSIKLPYKIGGLKNKKHMDVLVHKKSKCLELYYTSIDLQSWQNEYLQQDIAVYYDRVKIISGGSIFLSPQIQHILELNIGDIVMIAVSDSIIISKFDISDCEF